MKTSKSTPKTSHAISTRLPTEARHRLVAEAARRGLSVSDLVRALLLQSLSEESELGRLRLEVATLKSTMHGLRDDLAVAVKAILVTAGRGHPVTPEEAEAWVESNMKAAG
jgi:hypothetical protein